MSYWDSQSGRIVSRATVPYDGYPGWENIDCHCCGGLTWGSGSECRDCAGGGFLARHIASRRLALYPGGPFRGVDPVVSLGAGQ